MNILLTGGSGLLGREIVKLDADIIAPTSDEMDIRDLGAVRKVFEAYKPDIVLHLAASTTPPIHETQPEQGLHVNIIGTANIAIACHEYASRLVYTSTDYVYVGPGPHREDEPVFSPYRFGWSKLGGECAVRMTHNYLILRLSFGPRPFPWDKVYEDQYNSKLYVDEMAPLVLAAAKSTAMGVMNLGGTRTTLEDYARRTKPDIEVIPRPDWVPQDTSLSLKYMEDTLI